MITKIFETVPAGEFFLSFLHDIFDGIEEVVEVRTTAGEFPKSRLAGYNPDKGIVKIDMLNCCEYFGWMKEGATYVANVWFNLLFSAFHERAHVRQVIEDASLKDLENATEIMEIAANAEAGSALLAWCHLNPRIPLISEMGFAGERIKEVLNEKYAVNTECVLRELDLQGSTWASVVYRESEQKVVTCESFIFLEKLFGNQRASETENASMAEFLAEGVSDPTDEEEDYVPLVTSA